MEKLEELRLSFGPITSNNVGTLRKLNQTVFPVKYNNKFYEDIILTPAKFTKFAYFHGYAIGAISCRVEQMANGKSKIYIMTLGVLEPYRHRKVGARLLETVLNECKDDASVEEIYLHVQTSNTSAITFYKRFDFDITDTIMNYYKDIDPPNCYILKRIFKR